MALVKCLRDVCGSSTLLKNDLVVVEELQGCAKWVGKYNVGTLTIEALIDILKSNTQACIKKLSSQIKQPVRELISDLSKVLYREQEAAAAKPSSTIIGKGRSNEDTTIVPG